MRRMPGSTDGPIAEQRWLGLLPSLPLRLAGRRSDGHEYAATVPSDLHRAPRGAR
jgi:hypothetical protein